MESSLKLELNYDELNVISESLDLLRHHYGVDVTFGKVNIQDVIERMDAAIDMLENNTYK